MSCFLEDNDLAINFRNLQRVDSVQSRVQHIELMQHPVLGKMLIINGELQHVESWHPFYHEPLIHIPAAFISELRDVLILGGGSLFAAAEVLRYPTVRRCTLVDHDPLVLELMAHHYPHARQVLADERFVYIAQDAIEFLHHGGPPFDLIVNDCFDSVLLSQTGRSAFAVMSGRLSFDGVCSDLIYRHVFDRFHAARTRSALENGAPYSLSLITVPEYPGVLHLLACWGGPHVSQNLTAPRNSVQKLWLEGQARPGLAFYDPAFLSFHLYLPPYLRKVWETSSDERSAEADFVGRVV